MSNSSLKSVLSNSQLKMYNKISEDVKRVEDIAMFLFLINLESNLKIYLESIFGMWP